MDGRCGDRRWGVSVLAVLWPGRGILRGEINTKKTVVKKVKEKLAEGGGDLRSVLRQWNEGMFAERGVQASLEPPTESGGVVVDSLAPNVRWTQEQSNAVTRWIDSAGFVTNHGWNILPQHPKPPGSTPGGSQDRPRATGARGLATHHRYVAVAGSLQPADLRPWRPNLASCGRLGGHAGP